MKRYLFALGAAFIASSASVQAQTTNTNCQFVLGTMQCTSNTHQVRPMTPQIQQQQQPLMDTRLMTSPNNSQSIMDAFERGQRIRLMQEQQRALAADRRLKEQQAQQQSTHSRERQARVQLSCNLAGKSLGLEISESEGTVRQNYTEVFDAAFDENSVVWKSGDTYTIVSRVDLTITQNDPTDVMKFDKGTCVMAQRQF